MSVPPQDSSPPSRNLAGKRRAAQPDPREAITYFLPIEDREADHAPLSLQLIRRIFTYTRPYAAKRNRLFCLTLLRGVQVPMLAWMIGATINGPIAGRDRQGILLYSGVFLALVLFT
ncbi:MAG: msbA4, partial [Pedosphaera sp.]|nr:msbA4 [Pedosphaera sp.]